MFGALKTNRVRRLGKARNWEMAQEWRLTRALSIVFKAWKTWHQKGRRLRSSDAHLDSLYTKRLMLRVYSTLKRAAGRRKALSAKLDLLQARQARRTLPMAYGRWVERFNDRTERRSRLDSSVRSRILSPAFAALSEFALVKLEEKRVYNRKVGILNRNRKRLMISAWRVQCDASIKAREYTGFKERCIRDSYYRQWKTAFARKSMLSYLSVKLQSLKMMRVWVQNACSLREAE